jgi:hypothetical protein
MMTEKISLQDSTLSDERSPSPPPRHESWKRARHGKDGEYKSTATKVVADKIVSKILKIVTFLCMDVIISKLVIFYVFCRIL